MKRKSGDTEMGERQSERVEERDRLSDKGKTTEKGEKKRG